MPKIPNRKKSIIKSSTQLSFAEMVKASKKETSKLTSVTKSELKPTGEQKVILDAAAKNPKVLVIEAGAGTGKTSTLRLLGDVLKGNGQYTAFNSSLVSESKEKFIGTRISCNTTHSLAFRAEGKRFADRLEGGRIRSNEIADILGISQIEISVTGAQKQRSLTPSFLASQVTTAIKRFCQSADEKISENHFKYIDGIDMPIDGHKTYDNNLIIRRSLLPYAKKAWDDLSSESGFLQFNHDCYVKIWQLNNPVISADYILLDEAQDTAPVMLDILRQQTSNKILVGDSAQQIYEWRGAINAMSAFETSENHYLTQSFRFGPAIAEMANKVLGSLKQKTPLRLKGLESRPSKIEILKEPTAILCRTNALAIALFLQAIAKGKKAFLVGGKGDVVSFIEGAQELQERGSTRHPDLACFGSWLDVKLYSDQDEGEDLRLMVKIIDLFGCQLILNALRNMPLEEAAELVISTAHKSKGRQWAKVKLASDFPTKSRSDNSDLKLLYVALTRAMYSLDVSECPFFTGKDAMFIGDIQDKYKNNESFDVFKNSVLASNVATPIKPAVSRFSWSRNSKDGGWLIRGPKGFVGTTVTVYRADETSQQKYLSSIESEGSDFTLYRTY